MPRKPAIVPNVQFHTTISSELDKKLTALLWSELEGRIPKGQLQAWLERKIRESVEYKTVDIGELLGDFPGKCVVTCDAESHAYLLQLLRLR